MFQTKKQTTIEEANGWSPLRDGSIFFRQDQLYHINKLSQVIRKETGRRIKFGSPEEVMELLGTAYHSQNQAIQEAFHKAANSLSEELRKFFNV